MTFIMFHYSYTQAELAILFFKISFKNLIGSKSLVCTVYDKIYLKKLKEYIQFKVNCIILHHLKKLK